MTLLPRVLTAALISIAGPALAADDSVLPRAGDDIGKYRQVGDWTVYENRTRGSCFISRSDEAGYLVQMGLTEDNLYGYIGIFKKDAEIPEGEEAVAIVVNGNLYVGGAKNVVQGASGNYKGGYILADDRQLRLDLERADEMVVFPDLPFTITVNLDNSRNAIFEARECTGKLQGA